MKVIIAGSRTFDNGYLMIKTIKEFENKNGKISEIVCGMAKGADELGYNYARIWHIPVAEFPANWDMFGKSAGYIRNKEMAAYADGVIIFWDGKSRGSKHMIDLAKHYNLILLIKNF